MDTEIGVTADGRDGNTSSASIMPRKHAVYRSHQCTSATESSTATTARYPSSVKNALLYALARAASCRSSNCGASPLRSLRRETTTTQMTTAIATPTAAPKNPVMLCIAAPPFPFKRSVALVIHNVKYILLIVKHKRFSGAKKSTGRCSFSDSASGCVEVHRLGRLISAVCRARPRGSLCCATGKPAARAGSAQGRPALPWRAPRRG